MEEDICHRCGQWLGSEQAKDELLTRIAELEEKLEISHMNYAEEQGENSRLEAERDRLRKQFDSCQEDKRKAVEAMEPLFRFLAWLKDQGASE